MQDLNRWTGSGRLGKDPEGKYTPDGKMFTKFSLAVGLFGDKTMWLNVTIWGKEAEWANNSLAKGDRIIVDGRLEENTWEAADGQKKSMLALVAERIVGVSLKSWEKEEKSSPKPATKTGSDVVHAEGSSVSSDEYPF